MIQMNATASAASSRPVSTSVVPFAFLSRGARLYGCYHPPRRSTAGDTAVLICQSIGQEYIRGHRCCRLLAQRLAAAGLPTLRFDYFGCGDSAGEFEESSITTWLENVRDAADALRERGGARHIVLIGMRFGATLGALCAQDGEHFARGALWQPAVSGQAYLDEVRATHEAHETWSTREFGPPQRPPGDPDGRDELFGFVYPPSLREATARIDLLSLRNPPAPDVLLIDNQPERVLGPLEQQLAVVGAKVTARHEPDPGIWAVEPQGAVLPQSSVKSIVEWLTGEPR